MNNERKKQILAAILRYLRCGMSLNDLIESTDITHQECMEVLKEIEVNITFDDGRPHV